MRGDGRVYTRPESPYWWCAYYDAKGVEKREVCLNRKGEKLEATAENEEAARKYLRNLVDAVRAEKHGAPAFLGPEVRRQTVNEILNKLETKYEEPDEHGVCRKVGPQMKSHIKRLRNCFGDTRAVGVADENVAAFKRDLLTKGKKKATVNRSLQLLKQAYKISKLIAPEIKLFDESDNVRKGKLNEIEVNRLAASLPAYLADVVRFAYETGARVGEILKLEWDHVRGGVIYVPGAITKNGDPRQIVITNGITEILERRRATRSKTCNLIFHNAGNAIIDYRKAWHSACVINGLGGFYCRICRGDKGQHDSVLDAERKCPKCGRKWEVPRYEGRIMHDLRRSAAYELWKSGSSKDDCMAVTGHQTESMFDRYADLFSDAEKQARQRQVQERRRMWRDEQIISAIPQPGAQTN